MPYKDPEDRRRSQRERNKRWREAHPEQDRANRKRYYDDNAEKLREKSRRYYETHRETALEAAKDRNQTARYGIPKALLEMLGDSCAICGAKSGNSKGHRLHVDHCHDSKVIRGMLCGICNTGLGLFKHNPSLLLKAAQYLGAEV